MRTDPIDALWVRLTHDGVLHLLNHGSDGANGGAPIESVELIDRLFGKLVSIEPRVPIESVELIDRLFERLVGWLVGFD